MEITLLRIYIFVFDCKFFNNFADKTKHGERKTKAKKPGPVIANANIKESYC